MLCCHRMHSVWFRKAVRTTVWALLAWAAVDLGVPSVCALDRENRPAALSAHVVTVPLGDDASPNQPGHIDDCFCCSHCVNVSPLTAVLAPFVGGTLVALLPISSPHSAGYPSYHPPRA